MKLVNALSRFSFTCTNSVRTAAFAFVAAVVLFSTSPLFAQSSRQDSVVSQPIPGAWKFSPLSTFAPVFPSSSSSFSLQSQASRSSSDSSIFLSPRTVSADAVFSKTITNLGSPVLQNEQSQNNNNTGTGNTLSSAQTLLNAQAQQSSLKQDSNLSRVSSTLTTSQILSAPITNVGNVADQITTEIQALADSLGNSPARIFEYVYNAIEYEHYYGSKKGAHLTLLEGAGNDTDQCSLLVALLRASGYSSQYVQEWHLIPYDNVVDASAPYTGRSWLDLAETPYPGLSVTKPVSSWTDLQAKKTILLANFFSSVGFPVDYHASYPGFAFAYRTVVKTTVSSTVYYLDPSAKQIAGKAPANLATLAGFTATAKTTFLSNIGGTVSNNGITGVSFPNVKSNLTTYTNNFTTNLKNDTARRHDSVSDLLGRKLAQRVTVGAFGSWRGFLYATGSTIGDALPDTFMSKLKLSVNSGTETVILMPSLQGKRLAVTANGNTIQLRTDDATPTTLATVTAATYTLKLTAVHPNFAGSYFTENTYKKGPAYNYAIIYSFTGSKRFLDFRQKKLDALYREALAVSGSQNADGSLNLSALSADLRLKLSLESLNVTGLNWYYQTEMANQIAASLNNQNVTLLHRFGRMGQEEGFYIDVGLQYASNFPKDGTTGSYLSYGATFGYLFSALEHGVIDQYNGEPDKSVSTVQTFYRAITSSDGTKNVIYRGTSSNWTTVKNSLVGYATSALPATLDADTVLYVPKNANNGAAGWSWNGSGYASFSTGEDAGVAMIISGGYSGGYSPYVPTDLTVEPIVQNIASSLDNFSLGNTIVSLPQLPAPTVQIPVTAADPVDLATGAFTYDREDISLGSGGVRGLSFKRNYNSNRAAVNDARLGFGWTHNYAMKAVTRSAVDAGLGFTTAYEAAPILAAAVVINELVKDHTGPSSTGDLKSMVAAALVAKAAVDNLTNNAVAVQIGKDTYQFIKQPNGTYTPPAGSTLTLTETSTTVFTLQERHGNTYRFSRNNGGRVYEIEDPFGKKLLFTYNANGTIANIADACSRTLTFSYSNSLISSIADSTGRSVSFSYDANKNLTQISDPDTKVRKFEYDSSHRITYQRDPLDRIVLQNFYNANGQVTSQKLENNANKIWTMTYTGLRNTETDPLGNTKTYAYDKRGRVTDFWDARGTHRQLIYDGQDRVIE
ncbi:MAG: DUF6531 domain-containing protein, partial [Puniceicoccales bacterium]|nr:DUF6531 domain-containing protein [Puniceicoccales bacterium]